MSGFGPPPGGGFGGGGGFGSPPGSGDGGFGGSGAGGGFGPPGGGFGPPGGGFGQPPGGPGGYAPPPGGMAPMPLGPKTEALPIVSLVCGILGLGSCCCICFAVFPIAAIVTGAFGLVRIKNDPANLKGKELAIIGIALGALSLLLGIGMFIANLAMGDGSYQFQPNQFSP